MPGMATRSSETPLRIVIGDDLMAASIRLEMAILCSLAGRAGSFLASAAPATRPYFRRASPACLMSHSSKRAGVGLPKAVRLTTTPSDDNFLRKMPHNLPAGVPFTVLGIETSCDDTGVAIVRSDGTILGEALGSQAALHEEWGGVMPSVARDAHVAALDGVVAEALRNAGMESVAEVDAVAVTVGPGLEICLRVGCEGAKALALAHDKPFVGVHHLEAHVLMARLGSGCADEEAPPVDFPFLTLLTSGGHCQLLLTKGIGEHEVIGSTLDDALGEAYDKVARLLGLPVGGGGGPALEALARGGDPANVPLPIPMRTKKNYDFSFAGLKTAVRLAVERAPEETRCQPSFHADVAASFQHVAISHLEQRLRYAMTLCRESAVEWGGAPTTLVVSGGVAANKELRTRLQALCDGTPAPESPTGCWQLVLPPPRLCTDNGVMVAWAAVEQMRQSGSCHVADEQQVRARWPLGKKVAGAAPLGKQSPRHEQLRKGVAS